MGYCSASRSSVSLQPGAAAMAALACSTDMGWSKVSRTEMLWQDDSAGYAVASNILKQAVDVDTNIKTVEVNLETGEITVTLPNGGCGTVKARRGFTPAEQELAQRAVGQDATFTQNVAGHTFGRIYGQGALETAVALQGACALAVMEAFKIAIGEKFLVVEEAFSNKYDKFAGIVLDINDVPVSLMLVINGTNEGIGPDEDYEGNRYYKGSCSNRTVFSGL